MPLRVGPPMRWTVGAEQTGLLQGPGVPPIGLDLPGQRGTHRREVRVRHDDLVAQGVEAPGHPSILRRGLDEVPGSPPAAQHLSEPLGLGADAAFDHFTRLHEHANLAFLFVQIDANILHGWSSPPAPVSAFSRCGSVCHHIELGVSRFIPSILVGERERGPEQRALARRLRRLVEARDAVDFVDVGERQRGKLEPRCLVDQRLGQGGAFQDAEGTPGGELDVRDHPCRRPSSGCPTVRAMLERRGGPPSRG
jgi:hypothetical protein